MTTKSEDRTYYTFSWWPSWILPHNLIIPSFYQNFSTRNEILDWKNPYLDTQIIFLWQLKVKIWYTMYLGRPSWILPPNLFIPLFYHNFCTKNEILDQKTPYLDTQIIFLWQLKVKIWYTMYFGRPSWIFPPSVLQWHFLRGFLSSFYSAHFFHMETTFKPWSLKIGHRLILSFPHFIFAFKNLSIFSIRY